MGRLLALLLAAAVLAVGACGGDDDEEAGQPPPATTPGGEEAAAGRQIFDDQGCGRCHALAAADSSGTTGPDLDEALRGTSRAFIRKSIVDPNAEIEEGFSAGVMPTDFAEKLSDRELDQLVDFLEQSAG
jgi:mono/diheme cytochrome c family protein